MMFPNKKLAMRKKAMDSMMKGEAPSPMSRKRMSPDHGGSEDSHAGLVSMMVSPEEKSMILEHRKQHGGGDGQAEGSPEEEAAEGEY